MNARLAWLSAAGAIALGTCAALGARQENVEEHALRPLSPDKQRLLVGGQSVQYRCWDQPFCDQEDEYWCGHLECECSQLGADCLVNEPDITYERTMWTQVQSCEAGAGGQSCSFVGVHSALCYWKTPCKCLEHTPTVYACQPVAQMSPDCTTMYFGTPCRWTWCP